jgi:hypothetical protein
MHQLVLAMTLKNVHYMIIITQITHLNKTKQAIQHMRTKQTQHNIIRANKTKLNIQINQIITVKLIKVATTHLFLQETIQLQIPI